MLCKEAGIYSWHSITRYLTYWMWLDEVRREIEWAWFIVNITLLKVPPQKYHLPAQMRPFWKNLTDWNMPISAFQFSALIPWHLCMCSLWQKVVGLNIFISASIYVEQTFPSFYVVYCQKPLSIWFEFNKIFFLDFTGSKRSYASVLTCSCPNGPKPWTIPITNRFITNSPSWGEIITSLGLMPFLHHPFAICISQLLKNAFKHQEIHETFG